MPLPLCEESQKSIYTDCFIMTICNTNTKKLYDISSSTGDDDKFTDTAPLVYTGCPKKESHV